MRLLLVAGLAIALFITGCGGGGDGSPSSNEPLPEGQKGKWTVLVFMNAANDLYRYSTLNVNQMERVANRPDVRFVVQWKQSKSKFINSTFDGTRRYLARPDDTDAIQSRLLQDMGAGVDMGDDQTLREFVQWGKTTFPADRYLLVVWNHGNGWKRSPLEIETTRAVSYDDETGNAIQIAELPGALQNLGMDVVAFDASLMQMAEVAYEIRNVTPWVVGSEESPPGEGYPYDLVFKPFQDNPDQSTPALTKSFVDGMLAVPNYATRKITQSVIDTSKLNPVATAASQLANALIGRADLATEIQAARAATQGYSLTSSRRYHDLVDFCDELSARVDDPEIDARCAALKLAVLDAILWEGHNEHSSGSRGLAIDLSNSTQYRKDDYLELAWGKNTTWGNWLEVAP